MDFDLTDLRLFDEVLRAGSITGGARAANLSLAAASTRLRDLEIRTGVTLLERHRRGIRPTSAGAALHKHAGRMLQEARALTAVLQEHNRLLRGDLRLAVNTAALFHGFPELLAAFLRDNPAFDVSISECPSADVAEAVAQGRADLGIASDHASFAGLEHRFWREDRLILLLPADHVRAGRPSLALAEVAGESFVGLGEDSALQRHIEERAGRGIGRLRIRARLGNPAQLLRMVAAGAGIAIVPQVVLGDAPEGVAAVSLDEPWAIRRLCLIWRDTGLRPPLVRLIDHLRGG